MAWETGPDGSIRFSSLVDFMTAVLAETACGVQLRVARSEAELRLGGKTVQVTMTPQQARELSQALLLLAERAEAAPSGGTA